MRRNFLWYFFVCVCLLFVSDMHAYGNMRTIFVLVNKSLGDLYIFILVGDGDAMPVDSRNFEYFRVVCYGRNNISVVFCCCCCLWSLNKSAFSHTIFANNNNINKYISVGTS